MKTNKILKRIVPASMALALLMTALTASGCASIASRIPYAGGPSTGGVYSGVRTDVTLAVMAPVKTVRTGNPAWLLVIPCVAVDFPFSFVMDTVLLPGDLKRLP